MCVKKLGHLKLSTPVVTSDLKGRRQNILRGVGAQKRGEGLSILTKMGGVDKHAS